MNGLLVFPFHETNKNTNKQENANSIKTKVSMFLKTSVTFSGRTLGGGSITAAIITLSSILKKKQLE